MRHIASIAAFLLFLVPALAQGPIVLMGIDAEDNGPGSHGPISVYESVITNGSNTGVLNNVTNGGAGILVIGGGKASDAVTAFWNQINADLGPGLVTYVNGAANITSQSFAGFAMLAVVSDQFNTPSGGLTNAENDALTLRSADVANFINGGGGLLGFSSCALNSPYGYLGSIGGVTCVTPPQFSDITPTPAGAATGISNALDVCCWHDEYSVFPGFLGVLATNSATGGACAIGGQQVVIVQGIVLTPLNATNFLNDPHTVTATVADNQGNPVVGTTVTFDITAGPNAGPLGSGPTNALGRAEFTYTSTVIGTDTIRACFVDSLGVTRCATATKTWETPPAECYMFLGLQEGAFALGPDLDDVLLVLPLVTLPADTVNRPSLFIPNNPTLVGFTVSAQVGMYNPAVFPNNPLQLSNGLRLIIGVGTQNFGQNAGIDLYGHPMPAIGKNYVFSFTIAMN